MHLRTVLLCALALARIANAQTSFSSPRLAALAFARSNGLEVPENVVVLRETRADSTRPGPKATTPAEARVRDATTLASSLGQATRTGSVRDFLICRKLICAGSTDEPALVVEDARTDAKGTTVLIQLFQNVRIDLQTRQTISLALVQVKQVPGGWVAEGFRSPPSRAFPRVPPPNLGL